MERKPLPAEERQELESRSQEALQNSSLSSQSLADFCAAFPSLSHADFATILAPVADDDIAKPLATAPPLPPPPQSSHVQNAAVNEASASVEAAADNATEEVQQLVLPAETHGGRMGCVSCSGPAREVAFDTLVSPEGSASDDGEIFDVDCGSDSSDGSESDNTSDDKPGCKRDASDRVSSRPGAT